MNRNILRIVLFLVIVGLAVGCAAEKPMVKAQNLNPKLSEGLVPKVDNFLVILDGTASMADPYRGTTTKSSFAKGLASLMNQTIPDIPLNAGLRSFGDISPWTNQKTAIYYGMTRYTKQPLEGAIKDVGTSGNSPLELAIDGASGDLKSTSGKSALIIFSDGEDMLDAPVLAARNLKILYGDRVCIYTVLTGSSPAGKELLERIAQEGGCGFFVTGNSIASSEGMAGFVEKVFLTRKRMAAAAPAPPPPLPAEEVKETKTVKEAGPAIEAAPEKITLNVQFDTGKAVVKTKYYNEIKRVADFMVKHSETRAVIEGHTDNVGKEAANIKLSQNRANAIAKILVQKYGINKLRIKAVGYGPNRPIADNKTAEGRQKNRRVDAVFEAK